MPAPGDRARPEAPTVLVRPPLRIDIQKKFLPWWLLPLLAGLGLGLMLRGRKR